MGYDTKMVHEVNGQNNAIGYSSDYYRDRPRAEKQIRRKLGSAYFYLRPEEKEEYIRLYFRRAL
jgi:hypothetical protein